MSLNGKAQNYFKQEMQQQQAYYDSVSVNTDTTEGDGYAKFQKTLFNWGPRLLPDLDYEDYRQNMLNYASNYSAPQNYAGTGKWHLVGPDGNTTMGAKYTGQIHYIYFPNSVDTNTLFACSPTGGLFISEDGGDSWQNAGTDKGLPKCGVSSICIDTNGYWFVTTGNGEGYQNHAQWQASIGLYRSKDQGATWENIGLNNATAMRKVIEVKNNCQRTDLLVTTTSGLYRTRSGHTDNPQWTDIIGGDFYDVVLKPDDYNIAFASGSDTVGIYKINLITDDTTRILKTDTIIADDVKDAFMRRVTLKISSDLPDYLYAAVSSSDNGNYLYRYQISTNKWKKLGFSFYFPGYGRAMGWALKPDSDSLMLIYGRNMSTLTLVRDSIYSNINSDTVNSSYVYESSHADTHFLFFNPITGKIWQGNDGGVYKGVFTDDTHIDWTIKNKGLAVGNIEYIDMNSNGDFVTSGQFDNGSNTYQTTDGINWDINGFIQGGDGYQTVVNNSDNFFVSSQNGSISRYVNSNSSLIIAQLFNIVDFDCNIDTNRAPYANWSTYYQTTNNYLYMTGRKEVRRYNLSTKVWDSISSFSSSAIYPELGCNHSGTWEIEVVNDNNMYVSTYGNSAVANKNYFAVYKYLPQATGNRKWEQLGDISSGGVNKWIGAIHRNIYNSDSSLYAAKGGHIFYITWHGSDSASLRAAVWNDITYNLNPNQIQTINAIEQDGHGLYIATDAGVYFKPKSENHWYSFTDNLPNVMVKDIKLANNRLFVGTYGRGVWYGSAPGCDGTGDTLFLKNDTTYDNIYNPIIKYNVIFVGNGTTLTVKTELQMGVNAKIIVGRGATLDIDGGTITHACPDFWPGIEVRGNTAAFQDTVNQGRVIIRNGGTIEYAKTGIETIGTFVNYADVSYAGGIILADNATFYNNNVDVQFFPYPRSEGGVYADNVSQFINCSFVTDSNYYYYDDAPYTHVVLDGVRGVKLTNCVFENTTSLADFDYDVRGNGIEAWDAGYYVTINAEQPCSFNNLNYGIKSYGNTATIKQITIDGVNFNSNRTGCYLSAETFASIIRNTFGVTRIDGSKPDGHCGLYLDACTGYQVEENEFFSSFINIGGGTINGESFGIVVNNSGPEDNLIYNNHFHNCNYSINAQKQNRNQDGSTGLQIKCNLFEHNYQDITVTYSGTRAENYGIAEHQGSAATEVTAPAGNRFSHTDTWDYSDFNNEGQNIIYHLPSLQAVLQNRRLNPIYYSEETIFKNSSQLGQWDSLSGCPSHLSGNTKSEFVSGIDNNQNAETAYTDSLTLLTDEGNTTALNLDVVTSMPPETMQLRSQLLSASPYLSDTVMVNAAEKEDVLPNSIITEILTENPQSAKAENVLNTLNARNNPPSDNQMALIHANDSLLGHKEKLESKLSYHKSEKTRNVYGLVRYFQNDTLGTGMYDSIINALSNINTPEANYQTAFCYFNKGDSNAVVSTLAQIPSNFDLSAGETDYHNYFTDYFNILLSLQAQGKAVDETDSTQKSVLYNIVNNTNGILQAYARNILIKTDGFIYNEPYIFTDTTTYKSSEIKTNNSYSIWNTQDDFKLYPNPAQSWITIEYNTDNYSSKALIEIVSLAGKMVNSFNLQKTRGIKIIDLRNYPSGTYLIRFTENGRLLQAAKFVKY